MTIQLSTIGKKELASIRDIKEFIQFSLLHTSLDLFLNISGNTTFELQIKNKA